MAARRRVDWRAIPGRYRAWKTLPRWRQLLWLVSRGLAIGILYALFAVGILWYNEPAMVEGIAAGRESIWVLLGLLVDRSELLVLMVILLPAVIAGVLLPHRTDWS
jgi:hypothetical protein